MEMKIGYGKGTTDIKVPNENLGGVLKPNDIMIDVKGVDAVKSALDNPIGSPKLSEIVNVGDSVCIITSDITRPMPSKVVLPILLDELISNGVKKADIFIVFALGNHRPHTEDEKKYLVGEDIFNAYKCLDSDQSDIIDLGVTKYGTHVEVFSPVAKADKVICIGNIEYHYFAGYSGGAKAIMPGVSTASAIQSNHKRMVEATSITGMIDNNNVRLDIEEAIKLQKIDFIINVVLDEKKEIVKAVAGDYIKAHRVGCAFLDAVFKCPIEQRADIVIVTAGGYPKDINLYQAQKALDNSKHAVKQGGIIILVAACSEGLGEEVFERWMNEATCPHSMVEKISKKFELGGHKAASIAMIQEKTKIFLVSDMEKEFVTSMFFEPFDNAQAAIDHALLSAKKDASVIVMPYGGSTLPVVK
jgi:lactate racemase